MKLTIPAQRLQVKSHNSSSIGDWFMHFWIARLSSCNLFRFGGAEEEEEREETEVNGYKWRG